MNHKSARQIVDILPKNCTKKRAEKLLGSEWETLLNESCRCLGLELVVSGDKIFIESPGCEERKKDIKRTVWKQLRERCACGESFYVVKRGGEWACNKCGARRD